MTPEVDVAGVYISSMVPTALASLAASILLRKLLGRLGAYRRIWHPALFDAALFLVLWAIVVALPVKV